MKNFAAEQKEVVNNLPSGQDGGERDAPKPARSTVAIPSRVICRRPAGSRASVRRSPENFIPRGSLYQLDRGEASRAEAETINRKAKHESME